MPVAAAKSRIRMSADERRAQLIAAAVSEFALTGLHGTSTAAIARRAGISHPYLFRLFPTKKDLFCACAENCIERTLRTFREAAVEAETPDARLERMGSAYVEMLEDRELLRSQLQLFAACSDPDIRDVARRGFERIRAEIVAISGASAERARDFLAHGMLLNVAAALDAPELAGTADWTTR